MIKFSIPIRLSKIFWEISIYYEHQNAFHSHSLGPAIPNIQPVALLLLCHFSRISCTNITVGEYYNPDNADIVRTRQTTSVPVPRGNAFNKTKGYRNTRIGAILVLQDINKPVCICSLPSKIYRGGTYLKQPRKSRSTLRVVFLECLERTLIGYYIIYIK